MKEPRKTAAASCQLCLLPVRMPLWLNILENALTVVPALLDIKMPGGILLHTCIHGGLRSQKT